ncbi:hypothetical protein I4F81_007868 [Pyropia yezoensis]|uniref:Uncharacterized protein n=1 Tax=Pyropia yezoensis TaxID=2788 RepID=A0ACC3C557_PYRYE|nr:hypothetical protein I4F81_007868 [Neopyropia yezoensis]
MRHRDVMWQHVTRVGNTARYVCSHCAAELGKNPTHLKENMLTEACNAPVELRKIIHAKLVEGQNKAAAKESLHERREKRSSDQLYGASEAEKGTAGGALASGAASNAQRTASTGGGSSARSGGLRGFVSTMSAGENEQSIIQVDDEVRQPCFCASVALACRKHLASERAQKQMVVVDCEVERCCDAGDVIVGGDCFLDRKQTGIVSVLIFTPNPLYLHTGIWREVRNTAENTLKFFAEHIDKLGKHNVFAFVSDTGPKMQAVLEKLQTRYKGIVIVPCAAHCFDLLFGDITKHPVIAPATVFSASLSHYWRNRSLPKVTLERIQMQEYKAVWQLQSVGVTRRKTALLVSVSLLKTQTAMQEAVVDDQFKNVVLKDKDKPGKDDKSWADLQAYVDPMAPVANALDPGQGDTPGVGSVYSSFLKLDTHFQSFKYHATAAGARLKAHCLAVLQRRRIYWLRLVHILDFLLDPRHVDSTNAPTNEEMQSAMDLLVKLAEIHDMRLAMRANGKTADSELQPGYETPTRDGITADYMKFRAKQGQSFALRTVWDKSAVTDALLWWKVWARHLPLLQAIVVKVIKLPNSFAAGERAFSNVVFIQSVLRTKLSYERLHRLLYIYSISRALPDADVDASPDSSLDGDGTGVAGDGRSLDDEADGGEGGSDGSLSDVGDVADMLAVELGEEDGVVVEWGGDAGPLAGREDPSA